MASQAQRRAAKRNVEKAQAGARKKQEELNREAAGLDISGRSKMGKDELRRAIRRRGGRAD